ncbi:uncharacterized protein MONBRDRAFT_39161 [Monosiga brevicollis MX1]|uniref:RRM domain-containing protein n=1 Tax=Monosiga brevicollis TaxID=81824 RepID=A9VCL8_MONBE|nr:uncharacterized protein MONBRDRAFT_39161 [Monosiga brevicollis MX1]EDQ84707.1 predicted protein [Monosiga brevicollis MX1]|eukprot:XP_001750493.1 hypothetical protein [Monosiga brevicollis MX1]
MNVVREIQKLNERELSQGGAGKSWHDVYADSAYIYIGGLDYRFTEGDVLSVFSQYGEPTDINLVRDKDSGKSKGFCFLAYEDQRSTILAVDNFNGVKLAGRTIRVDHCGEYEAPEMRLQRRKERGLNVTEEDESGLVDAKGKLLSALMGETPDDEDQPSNDGYELIAEPEGDSTHRKKDKKKHKKHKKHKRHHSDRDADRHEGEKDEDDKVEASGEPRDDSGPRSAITSSEVTATIEHSGGHGHRSPDHPAAAADADAQRQQSNLEGDSERRHADNRRDVYRRREDRDDRSRPREDYDDRHGDRRRNVYSRRDDRDGDRRRDDRDGDHRRDDRDGDRRRDDRDGDRRRDLYRRRDDRNDDRRRDVYRRRDDRDDRNHDRRHR